MNFPYLCEPCYSFISDNCYDKKFIFFNNILFSDFFLFKKFKIFIYITLDNTRIYGDYLYN